MIALLLFVLLCILCPIYLIVLFFGALWRLIVIGMIAGMVTCIVLSCRKKEKKD